MAWEAEFYEGTQVRMRTVVGTVANDQDWVNDILESRMIDGEPVVILKLYFNSKYISIVYRKDNKQEVAP